MKFKCHLFIQELDQKSKEKTKQQKKLIHTVFVETFVTL